ncbi:stalk domain-containing protein [Sedimentibacter sp.]|uniref:stalk domain-containing protein n=1 Tax=Sedimentibacter sp. TaxID=1960295 RepID=UPI0028AD0D70|nr:stalk domain-containing protein [Sedimentibacter sp.]
MYIKSCNKFLLSIMLIMGLMMVPVYAAQTEVISLVDADSGYKIVVPNFVDVREVEVDGEIVKAVVAEKPVKDSLGTYTFFEIQTTNEDASMIASAPGTFYEQIGDLFYELEDGKVAYRPSLYVDLEEIFEDNVFVFDFSVTDADGEVINVFNSIYFVFVEAEESAETPAETPETTVEETAEETAETPEAAVETPVQEATAVPTASEVVVDGKNVSFEAYNIDGYNYFKLRDLAMAVTGSEKQFEVTWDAEKNAINLVSGEVYTPVGGEFAVSEGTESVQAIVNQSTIYIDGEEIALQAYTIGGNNYFKLRDVGEVFDIGVLWDGELNQIAIDTVVGYVVE